MRRSRWFVTSSVALIAMACSYGRSADKAARPTGSYATSATYADAEPAATEAPEAAKDDAPPADPVRDPCDRFFAPFRRRLGKLRHRSSLLESGPPRVSRAWWGRADAPEPASPEAPG